MSPSRMVVPIRLIMPLTERRRLVHCSSVTTDELRHLDWKAFGKFDKYYVKRFEHETNLRAYFLVDASGSMAYRGEASGLTKLAYACTLAATLSYLLLRQQDAVGLVIFGGPELRYLPPRASTGHLPAILTLLEGLSGEGGTDLAAADHGAAMSARDSFGVPQVIRRGMRHQDEVHWFEVVRLDRISWAFVEERVHQDATAARINEFVGGHPEVA